MADVEVFDEKKNWAKVNSALFSENKFFNDPFTYTGLKVIDGRTDLSSRAAQESRLVPVRITDVWVQRKFSPKV